MISNIMYARPRNENYIVTAGTRVYRPLVDDSFIDLPQ